MFTRNPAVKGPAVIAIKWWLAYKWLNKKNSQMSYTLVIIYQIPLDPLYIYIYIHTYGCFKILLSTLVHLSHRLPRVEPTHSHHACVRSSSSRSMPGSPARQPRCPAGRAQRSWVTGKRPGTARIACGKIWKNITRGPGCLFWFKIWCDSAWFQLERSHQKLGEGMMNHSM